MTAHEGPPVFDRKLIFDHDLPRCPYCGGMAVLGNPYSHRPDLAERRFWICVPCEAWVGVHRNTTRPLGTLAKKPLREARMRVHSLLDAYWQGYRSRDDRAAARAHAYMRLARGLSIDVERCHVAMFDLETCERALRVLLADAL